MIDLIFCPICDNKNKLSCFKSKQLSKEECPKCSFLKSNYLIPSFFPILFIGNKYYTYNEFLFISHEKFYTFVYFHLNNKISYSFSLITENGFVTDSHYEYFLDKEKDFIFDKKLLTNYVQNIFLLK